MEGRGFINDKLELKFLLLYIAARVVEPVPFDTLLDLALCDDAVDYFDFAECLRDLVDTGHLSRSAEGLYDITAKGRRDSAACESSLPYSVRLRCDKNLSEWNRRLRRQSQVRSSVERRGDGAFVVELALDDDLGSVMELRLTVPREDMARALADRFRRAPEKTYGGIMSLLLDGGGKPEA